MTIEHIFLGSVIAGCVLVIAIGIRNGYRQRRVKEIKRMCEAAEKAIDRELWG